MLSCKLSRAYILRTTDVTQQTILLRRQYKKLKLGDAIIAATALVNNLTIITRNTSDFKNITDIKVVNPFDM
jgi:predicted nucleic acid-binding protein